MRFLSVIPGLVILAIAGALFYIAIMLLGCGTIDRGTEYCLCNGDVDEPHNCPVCWTGEVGNANAYCIGQGNCYWIEG